MDTDKNTLTWNKPMDGWLMRQMVRRFNVGGDYIGQPGVEPRVICETGDIDRPYVEYAFRNGRWEFIQVHTSLPSYEDLDNRQESAQ